MAPAWIVAATADRIDEPTGWGSIGNLALGLAFRGGDDRPLPVAVLDGPGVEAIATAFEADPAIEVRRLDADAARAALRRGRVDLVVVPGDPVTLTTRGHALKTRGEYDASVDAYQQKNGLSFGRCCSKATQSASFPGPFPLEILSNALSTALPMWFLPDRTV